MRTLLLATASLLGMSLLTPALAATAEDAAYNSSDKPIYDTSGKCVRTVWNGVQDPCAPAPPPPAPKPVVVAPQPAPMPQISREQRTVYFEFDGTRLNADATAKLDQLVTVINQSTAITGVSIHGFTDQIGTNSYNEALAHKRAQAVKGYLDQHSRIKTIEGDIRGLGKSETDGHCLSIKNRAEKITCMAPQRRVEVEFQAQQ